MALIPEVCAKWGGMGSKAVTPMFSTLETWGHMGRNRVSPLEMGTRGGGGVFRIPMIAGIAEIARDRKGKTSPLIKTDNTDLKKFHRRGRRCHTSHPRD